MLHLACQRRRHRAPGQTCVDSVRRMRTWTGDELRRVRLVGEIIANAFATPMARQERPLPDYVQREFEDYLRCGRFEHGFLRVRCDTCHGEHLVALTCHSYYASWVLAVVVWSAATRAIAGSSYMNRPTSSRR